ncbi:MAG: Trehalose transport system permease protein SugB, partial [Pseudomonadota bacterium]
MATLGLELERSSASRNFDPKWLIMGFVVLVVAWLALVPLGFLLWQSFMTPASAAAEAEFTFRNYLEVYTSSETLRLFGNSTIYALGSSILALVIGTGLAWVCERTNTPF